MRTNRTALVLAALILADPLTWAATFPKSIIPVARATVAQGASSERTYGRITRMALTPEELAAPIDFDLTLKLRNREELDARINRGEILSRAALENYLPTAADYARVRAWLVAQGFEITLDASSRHAIFARGSNARVATALGLTLARVATSDGEFTSAVTAPSLPDEIAGLVAGIRGLQPHLIRHPRSGQLEPTHYYAITPAAVAAAYQAPSNLTGAGQTIAVVGDSIPNSSDLSTFWSECGIPGSLANISVTNVQGGPGTDTTSQSEVSMDVEWTSGLAPSANVRIYAVPYPMSSNSEAAVYTQILNDLPSYPSLHQVTESYGGMESDDEGGDSSLVLLVAQGVTCFASSGDGGSNPDPNSGGYDSSAALSVSYPASDPSMTAVGGTTLVFPESLSGQSVSPEVAWSLTTYQSTTGATGGGISGSFIRPSWQVATGMPAGNKRCVPDVSALAYTGSADTDMAPFVYQGGTAWGGSGTSLSSPIWAGFCALINQSRANASLPPVGFLNPKLYAAAGTAAFTDITSGSNGAYSAGYGYDLCTGLGTPLMGNLITYLCTVKPTAPVITDGPPPAIATTGFPYSFAYTSSGYPAATFSVISGSLPPGITLSAVGVISGTPTQAGVYSGTVSATNGIYPDATQSFSITVQQALAPSITNGPPPATVALGASYNFTYTGSGYPLPTFAVTSGSLPAGLTLSHEGVISGTPTASGLYTGTVTASNGVSPDATQTFSIAVQQAPTITNAPLSVPIAINTLFSFTYKVSGYPAPTFTVTSGSLPPGLTLSPAGTLSGTATQLGTFTGTVAANNVAGSASQNFTISVVASQTLWLNLPGTVNASDPDGQGTATISAVLANDLTVQLISSNTGALTVPASVVIPAGQTSAAVAYTIIDNLNVYGPQTTIVTASASGQTAATQLVTVTDNKTTDNWSTFGNGQAHTGVYRGSLLGGTYSLAWSATFPSASVALNQVAVAKGVAYITPDTYLGPADLTALSASTGAQIWQHVYSAAGQTPGGTS